MGLFVQQLKHAARNVQTGLEQLALHMVDASGAQQVLINHFACPHHQLQMQDMAAQQLNNFQILAHMTDSHHQNAGAGGTYRAQHVQTGGVAKKHPVLKPAGRFDGLTRQSTPTARAMAAKTIVQPRTWALPQPKMGWRSAQRRLGSSYSVFRSIRHEARSRRQCLRMARRSNNMSD